MKRGTQLAVSLAVIIAGTAAVRIVALQGAAQQGVPPAARLHDRALSPSDIGVSSLGARAKAQRDTVEPIQGLPPVSVPRQRDGERHHVLQHVVDDAARFHKPVHYDHGTGIAAADVDGDGLEDIYFVNQLTGSQLWKNLGGGKFRNLNRRPASRLPIGWASRRRSPTSTTTATRICSSRRSVAATCYSRTTGGAFQGHHEGRRR